ncbi:M18 family aminopeptidase [Peptoniphilus asaccharolyticus]
MDRVKDLIGFIDKSMTAHFAVKNMVELLDKNGYKEWKIKEEFKLDGSKFYVKIDNTALLALNIGDKKLEDGFKIIGSHTDSPTFRIKRNPIMKSAGNVILNTEIYGGPILYTWMDRPLSAAGRISFLRDGKVITELVDFKKPIFTIPSLAIHMNREVNKGFEFNAQKHTLPLMALDSEEMKEDVLLNELAKIKEVDSKDILDYDLYIYDTSKGELVGLKEEFISQGRQDNLFMAYTSLVALLESEASGVNVFLATDNEEVGSTSYAGADSPVLDRILERVAIALGVSREEYLRALERSFLISADAAHAVHPNFSEKADPTNQPVLGGGPVIKYAASRAYTSDSYSAGRFIEMCSRAKVPFQTYHNRSDVKGGSTIGPISQSQIAIKSVDIGMSTLGMHSARELTGATDVEHFINVFLEFYK